MTWGKWLMTIGSILILSAGLLIIYNLSESARAGRISGRAVGIIKEKVLPENNSEEDGKSLPLNDTIQELQSVHLPDGEYIGILDIKPLGISLPVRKELTVEGLRNAPCRYAGSCLTNDMIIGGHNYRQHFGSLSSLQMKDEIIFTDTTGNAYRYQVQGLEMLSGNDAEGMKKGVWDLTLFTCNYDGSQRVTIRCQRVAG